jgi:uncharacterized protein YecT (DUF1311 family)
MSRTVIECMVLLGPSVRRLNVVVVLTVLLVTMPIVLLILATGNAYKKVEGRWQPIFPGARTTYAGILVVWLAGAFVYSALFPEPGITRPAKNSQPGSPSAPVASPANPSGGNVSQASHANQADASAPPSDNAQAPGRNSDPLENRYSAQFKQCMATGDAANGSTSATLACTDDELRVQDQKLNQAYRTLMGSLAPDKQADLRNYERAWIKQREAQCPEGDSEANGQIARLDRPACLLSQTMTRTIALEKLRDMPSQPEQ